MIDRPKGPLIPSRVLVIGEKAIPRRELEKLSDEEVQVFLREPDPNKWPTQMAHLRKYLPQEEQIKWHLHGLLTEHERLLDDSLRLWALSVWRELDQRHNFSPEDRNQIIGEMADFLKSLIKMYLAEEQNGDHS